MTLLGIHDRIVKECLLIMHRPRSLPLGKSENRIIQPENLRVQIKVILRDIIRAHLLRSHWLAPILVLDVGWGLDALVGAADVAVGGEPGFEVAAADHVKVFGAAEVAWTAAPGVVCWQWGGRGVGWVEG
jgi:hypothetical protein